MLTIQISGYRGTSNIKTPVLIGITEQILWSCKEFTVIRKT